MAAYIIISPAAERAVLALSRIHRSAFSAVIRPDSTRTGTVKFGFAGKGLWHTFDRLRAGPPRNGFIPVQLGLVAEVKFFGRTRPAGSGTASS
jgi:hypothetical protein